MLVPLSASLFYDSSLGSNHTFCLGEPRMGVCKYFPKLAESANCILFLLRGKLYRVHGHGDEARRRRQRWEVRVLIHIITLRYFCGNATM